MVTININRDKQLNHLLVVILFSISCALTLVLCQSSANASDQLEKSFKIHVGDERRDKVDWEGAAFGIYKHKFSKESVLPGFLQRHLSEDHVSGGIEFAVQRADRAGFTETRYDLSIIPKVRYRLTPRIYFSTGMGIAYNELRDENTDEVDLALGGNLFFAPEASFGYDFIVSKLTYFVEATFAHRSNGRLANNNQSLNLMLIALGIRFD